VAIIMSIGSLVAAGLIMMLKLKSCGQRVN